jgi:hypothetical protein
MEDQMRKLRLWSVAGLALVLAAAPASAVASPTTFTLGPPVNASGTSPFAACPIGSDPNADPPSVNYVDTEVEPFVAINPRNHNIIGVYQQDRWTDGGAKGLLATRSSDGGATWAQNFAEFSQCSDSAATTYTSPFPRATDPWVSYDSAGKAYQISLGIVSATATLSGVEVATSTNDGASWSVPVRIITDDDPIFFNDKESITADWRPTAGAGKAYATWIRGNLPGWDNISIVGASRSFAFRGLPMFAKTVDGGQTWSAPVPMIKSNIFAQGNQIAVLPDGTLVNVYGALFLGSGIQPSNQAFWGALRSTNGGKTWGGPIKIAELNTALLTNPDIPNPTSLDQTVRAGDYLPDVAVDQTTGALYMVFADSIGGGINHVKLTKSTNGGKTWTTPKDITATPSSTHSFNGTVEVAADGTVAVMYYDFRNNTSAAGLPTDVWFAHSHDGGATWSEQHVYGPFDMENAPVARGWFLGDYMGMAAIGKDMLLFFSVSTGANDSADVIAVRASR